MIQRTKMQTLDLNTQDITQIQEQIAQLEWQVADEFDLPSQFDIKVLSLMSSMTSFLESQCQTLSVQANPHQAYDPLALTAAEKRLLGADLEPANLQTYLLREVTLLGDNAPWVIARTLIPQNQLANSHENFANQGNIPIGKTAFAYSDTYRDQLEFAILVFQNNKYQEQLIARRSRIWVEQTPLLVAEVFLPGSPVYSKGK